MGSSLRTERFRYTRWTAADGTAESSELYDYQEDPLETINRVSYPEHAEVVKRLDSIVVSRIATPSTQHKIRFNIQGENLNGNYGPLEGVSLTMAGETMITGPDGELLFTHHKGSSTYSMVLSGYKSLQDSLDIGQDTIINLKMELEDPIYELSIKATDRYTGKALINASVSLDGDELKTDNSGMVLYHVKSNTYLLRLQKDLYPEIEEEVSIFGDTALFYRLKASHATVKIRLKEGTTPVNNASVTLGSTELLSNGLGISKFETLSTGLSYDYLVTKEGYHETEGSLLLNADTTVDLQMERFTAVLPGSKVSNASIWPNPAGDKLFFKTDEIFPVKKIELLDVMGRVTMGLQPADRYVELNIAHLSSGPYWFRWETIAGARYLKLMKN